MPTHILILHPVSRILVLLSAIRTQTRSTPWQTVQARAINVEEVSLAAAGPGTSSLSVSVAHVLVHAHRVFHPTFLSLQVQE
eukprot:3616462-Rhodomonas_salina.1